MFWSFLGGFLGNLILIPSGRENITLYSSIVSAIVNLVLNLLFIPKWGIEVAAITTALSMAIGFFFKLPFIDRDISIAPWKDILLGPIVGCVFLVLLGWGCSFLPVNAIIRFIVIVGIGGIAYFICLLKFKNQLACEAWNFFMRKIKANDNIRS